MNWTNVNPVSVAKQLVKLCEIEFEYDPAAEPTEADKMVAYTLFEKFAKISNCYKFMEDTICEEGGKISILHYKLLFRTSIDKL